MSLVLTYGFDDRDAIRAVMRVGIDRLEKILVIAPPVREGEPAAALQRFQELISYVSKVEVGLLDVDVSDPQAAVATIAGALLPLRAPLIVSLCGWRHLSGLALIAALMTRPDCTVELIPEGGGDVIKVHPDVHLLSELDAVDRRLILTVADLSKPDRPGVMLRDVVEALGGAKTTLWRKIKRLEAVGLLYLEPLPRHGRPLGVRLTERGLLIARVFSFRAGSGEVGGGG